MRVVRRSLLAFVLHQTEEPQLYAAATAATAAADDVRAEDVSVEAHESHVVGSQRLPAPTTCVTTAPDKTERGYFIGRRQLDLEALHETQTAAQAATARIGG